MKDAATSWPGSLHADIRDRFLRRVSIDLSVVDRCWTWTGSRTSGGYGRMRFPSGDVYAHRLSWEIANDREVPAGLVVRHRCDNPPCVRPDHLLIGTHADNMRDAADRGRARGARGEDHCRHKLTAEQVAAIRSEPDVSGLALELAKRYGVGVRQIWQVRSGRAWKHVVDGYTVAK